MTKANQLRNLFPNYVGAPFIEVYEDDDDCTSIVYLDIPNNRIEVLYSSFDYSAGEWYSDIERTTLDDDMDGVNSLDDGEFNLLVKGLKQ